MSTISKINLYLGDCMDAMAKMPDKSYDLAIVDPPYGIKESAHRNISRSKLAKTKNYKKEIWDFKIPTSEYFEQLFRISENQIIWGINYFTFQYEFSPGRIVWYKDNGSNDFSDCELAYQSFRKTIKFYEFKWMGMLQDDMKNKQERIHPTEKPIALYKWILKNYAKPGDKILDTHGGSMSIAIACHDMGFDLDLWEIDPDYYAAGVKRFEQHKQQQKLFTPKEMY